MSTNDSDEIVEPNKALIWMQLFKIGIIAFLFVVGGFTTFKIGQMKTCNDANGTLVEGICRGIDEVGVVRLCQPNPIGEAEICSRAIINDPVEFCTLYGAYLVRE